jgi:RNA polymerase sigma-70 factor (ECF subfamily)
MARTYDRFASPPDTAAAASADDGGGVIAAKDRPGDLSGASDQEVVARAVAGQEAAFRELVRRYERPVFSLLYRMVRDRALAEDLAQETFIKVLNGIRSYNPQYKFSSWLFKIAHNAAIDHLRKRELDTLSLDGSPRAASGDAARATAPQLGDRAASPLHQVEARELGAAIEQAIARLRPEYRSCILLRFVEGYSYEEIAEILDVPLGTVKTHIHRARNELRRSLEDHAEPRSGTRETPPRRAP